MTVTLPRVIARRNQPTTRGSRFSTWTPFQIPARPPSGSYDPALDSQQGAAQRGFADIQQDTETAGQRANTDFTTNRADLTRNRGYGVEDFATERGNVERNYGRSLADILRAKADVTQGYNRLGSQQAESAAARGVTQGGTLAAALAARTGNEAHDQAPLDTSRTRLGEDRTNQLGQIDRQQQRFMAGYDDPTTGLFAKLDTGYQRGVDDRSLDVARQGRELGFYNQDVGAARFFQAGQMGYVPPQRPGNEFVGAHGPYRVVMRGGKPVRVTPTGSPYR